MKLTFRCACNAYCFLVATTTPHQSSHQDLQAKGNKHLSHDTPLILMITICHYQIFVYHCQYACHPDTFKFKVVQVGVKKYRGEPKGHIVGKTKVTLEPLVPFWTTPSENPVLMLTHCTLYTLHIVHTFAAPIYLVHK